VCRPPNLEPDNLSGAYMAKSGARSANVGKKIYMKGYTCGKKRDKNMEKQRNLIKFMPDARSNLITSLRPD